MTGVEIVKKISKVEDWGGLDMLKRWAKKSSSDDCMKITKKLKS